MTPEIRLENGSVAIRPWRATDASAALQAIQESPSLSDWLPGLANLTLEQIQNYITTSYTSWSNGTAYNLVIAEAATDRFLGGIGLTFIHPVHRFANLYYWVRSSDRGRSVAPIAVRLAADLAFTELNLVRVEIVTALENIHSRRVAEKAGATLEGTLRHRILRQGQPLDAHMYSLIRV